MVLTVDIGNTNITLGGFVSDEPVFVSRISTSQPKTEDELAIRILGALSLYGINKEDIDGVIVASVVPPLNFAVRKASEFIFGIEPLFVGRVSRAVSGSSAICPPR